jgi:transposase
MNVHKSARMTVLGRLLLVRQVREVGWRVMDAAAAAGVSERTAYTWLARYRAGGEPALHDRSSAPARSPRRLPAATIAAIERLRRQRWSGPRIARALGRLRSTVGTVLRRLGLGRLAGLDVKEPSVRYQRAAAGELIHLDVKKLAGSTVSATASPATGTAAPVASAGNTCMSPSTTPRGSPRPSSCRTSAVPPAPLSSPVPPPGLRSLVSASSAS